MEDMREDLNDISLNDEDLDELFEDNDLSDEDLSVDETEDNDSEKKKGNESGKKKKFPIIAVFGLLIVIIGVAVLGLMLGKKRNSSRRQEPIMNELPENVEPETQAQKQTNTGSQSAEEILAKVRGEKASNFTNETTLSSEEETEEEIEENGETVNNRDTRIEELELDDTESKYEVIIEKPKVNFRDIEYSQDIEATYTIIKWKEKNKEIFYAEQDGESFKVDRVDIVAEGSISGLTGTWELSLPYSTEWKLGDMITITYKMGEIDSSSRVIIDLKVKDYNKISNEVIENNKQSFKGTAMSNSY